MVKMDNDTNHDAGDGLEYGVSAQILFIVIFHCKLIWINILAENLTNEIKFYHLIFLFQSFKCTLLKILLNIEVIFSSNFLLSYIFVVVLSISFLVSNGFNCILVRNLLKNFSDFLYELIINYFCLVFILKLVEWFGFI